MNRKLLLTIVVLATLLSVPLGKILWPPSPEIHMPTAQQIPFFIVISLVEGFALCAGIVFVLQIWPLIKKLPQTDQKRFKMMGLAIAWSLINWWAHDNLHVHNGQAVVGLLMIEFGFHVTLILSALVLAYNFFKLVDERIK
jgi:hypothetical protein